MTALKLQNDPAVQKAIDEATAKACEVLDAQFPGWDAGGITSNFQGLLAEVITRMLPRLIVDETFFGCPLIRGDMFLIHKPEKPVYGEPDRVLVLEPGASSFKPIANAGDAFTSFDAAAAAAMKYLEAEQLTLEQAKALQLSVVPVVFDPQSTSDCGFKIVSPPHAA
ncbi:hypothetical protein ACM73L_32985 [Pseudomonas aeruginosa]